MENNMVPKIRFSRYSCPWKLYRMEDVIEEFSNKSSSENEYPLLSSTNTGMELREGRVSGSSNKGYKIIDKDDLVFSPQNLWLGNINVNNWGKGIVSPSYKTYKLRNIDAAFFNALVRMPYMMDAYYRASVQGASVVRRNLDLDRFNQIEMHIPSEEEQQDIGRLSNNLEALISLYELRLDGIKNYKEGLLQKMFPQEGNNVPQVRFPGFENAWQERSLGNIYSERNERGNETLQFLTVSIHSGVSDGELDEDNLGKVVKRSEDKSTYKRVYPGDLVFNMMRAWQGAIGVVKSEGMISPAYISAIPSDEVFPLFMDYALRRKEIIAQINNLSYGVTDFRKRLYWNSFVKVKCMLPSKEEQEKIWGFFKQIDELTSLYQQKLKALTEYKKGLLQQMFV